MKFGFFKWLAGFFEDKQNKGSSKRATLYICLYLLYMLTRASITGGIIDVNILLVIAGIILFCVGAVTSEFFKKLPVFNKENEKEKKD